MPAPAIPRVAATNAISGKVTLRFRMEASRRLSQVRLDAMKAVPRHHGGVSGLSGTAGNE